MKKETKEAWLRIPIGIISGIIADLWGVLTFVMAVLNFFYTIFKGKRNKNLADFTNIYVSFIYDFLRYMTFTTNERPFPFNSLGKPKDKVNLKFQN